MAKTMVIRVKKRKLRLKNRKTSSSPTHKARSKRRWQESEMNGDSDSDYSDTDLMLAVLSDDEDGESGESEKTFMVNDKQLRIKHDLQASITKDLGAMIWPSSKLVCRYFELYVCPKLKRKSLKGHRILEIGAGVGLAGLACAAMGAYVMSTSLKVYVAFAHIY